MAVVKPLLKQVGCLVTCAPTLVTNSLPACLRAVVKPLPGPVLCQATYSAARVKVRLSACLRGVRNRLLAAPVWLSTRAPTSLRLLQVTLSRIH